MIWATLTSVVLEERLKRRTSIALRQTEFVMRIFIIPPSAGPHGLHWGGKLLIYSLLSLVLNNPMLTQNPNTLMKASLLFFSLILPSAIIFGATRTNDLFSADGLTLHNAVAQPVEFKGKHGLKVEISEAAKTQLEAAARNRPAGARGAGEANRVDHLVVVDKNFHNGTIEVEIAGQPSPGASGGARGFVGVAFRVQPDM